jgi:hypothetical protein
MMMTVNWKGVEMRGRGILSNKFLSKQDKNYLEIGHKHTCININGRE